MRALRRMGLVSAGLLGVLILALLWLTLTASGLRTGLALTARLVPGELRWDDVDGRLAGPLAIRGLRFTGQAGDYRLERLDFDWSPAALSRGTLHVERLHLEGVRLAPAPAAPADAATQFQPPDIRLPLRIVLGDIRVERLEFIPPEGQPLTVEHLYLDAGAEAQQLQLKQLDLALPGIGLQASGTIALAAAGATRLAFHWQADLPDLPAYAGAGELSGDWQALHLTHRLERPAAAVLELQLRQPLVALQWSLDLSLPETALNTFVPALPRHSLALVLQAEGDLDRARFEARLESDHPQLQAQPLELQGRASQDGWTDYRLEDAELRLADSRLQLAGHWSLDAARGRLELDWPALYWPPADPAFSARTGRLVWEGGLAAFSLNLQSALTGAALPDTQLALQGRGDAAGFDLTRLQAGLLGGEVQAEGRIGWGDGLAWQLQLAAQGIDPGRHWPDWPGELAARIESSGDMRNQALTARVTLHALDGRLRGLPLSGGGRFDTAPGGWRFADLELRTGANRLALNGGPGMPQGLDWELDFPDLAASLPGVNGVLQGQGRLTGDWPQLRATGAIEVQDLGLAQLTLARAELDFDAGLDGVSGRTNMNLNGSDWAWQGRGLKTVTASLDGTLADHRLRLEASGPGHGLRLALSGGWTDPDWRGHLATLDWELPETGAWTLSVPVEVTAGRETARLAPACWTQATAELCLEGRAEQAYAAWQAEASLNGLPLNRLRPWLPVDVEFDSNLSATATAAQQAGRLRSEGEIRIPAGTLAWGEGEGRQRLPRGEAGADWRLDATGLQARARFGLLEQDRLTAQLALPGFVPGAAPATQPIEGKLQGEIRQLEVIELFVPVIAGVEGQLQLDTRIRGSLAAPELDVGARLREAALWVPAAGIRLEEVALSLDSVPGGRVQLRGGARSGAGRVDLNGELGFRNLRDWTARLALQGEDFLVLDLPEAHLPVTPDLQLQVVPPRIDLTGSVHVPQARLEPRDFSGAVGPSRDVVVVTDSPDASPRWQVHTRLQLSLGDAVIFEGYGLSGRLVGQLELIDEPGQLTRARGELQVVDGSYTAYGQALEISRGRVIYSGGPVDDPAIDATAVRRVGEVTAGIRLGGYLQQPELELFSRPSMAEADVLSYLMLGRPMSGASGAEGQLLLRAATAMGVKGGDALAGRIGESLGLDEVSVSGGETAQDAALMLGKYLSPRLYVNYSVGLFDSLNTLNLRYELSRRWTLESEVGVETGADLLFNIER